MTTAITKTDNAPERCAPAAGYAYGVKLVCKCCGGDCWIHTQPMEICDETHRCNARLCRECWDKSQAEYHRFTQRQRAASRHTDQAHSQKGRESGTDNTQD